MRDVTNTHAAFQSSDYLFLNQTAQGRTSLGVVAIARDDIDQAADRPSRDAVVLLTRPWKAISEASSDCISAYKRAQSWVRACTRAPLMQQLRP